MKPCASTLNPGVTGRYRRAGAGALPGDIRSQPTASGQQGCSTDFYVRYRTDYTASFYYYGN